MSLLDQLKHVLAHYTPTLPQRRTPTNTFNRSHGPPVPTLAQGTRGQNYKVSHTEQTEAS
jgi:hypothetical protein